MFAVEIDFQDGVSAPETILVRRPQALIGASDYAHVMLEDMKGLEYQLRISRDIGRKFSCTPVPLREGVEIPSFLAGSYEGQALIDPGPVKLFITVLDADLMLREAEPPDRAGVRVLRTASAAKAPLFPAVLVKGVTPTLLSFSPDQPIYIGRSRACALRLDSSEISGKHARLGYEAGEFWIEDLGSTNGTFVRDQQISGRVSVSPGAVISLGREVKLVGITAADQVAQAAVKERSAQSAPAVEHRKFPCLVSVSEVARPARLVLEPGAEVSLGRDPASDVWLGAPHVSRKHCLVSVSKTGQVRVEDQSTNGTGYGSGVLRKHEILEVKGKPYVLDFGGRVTVALCFDDEQVSRFTDRQGSPRTFVREGAAVPGPKDARATSLGIEMDLEEEPTGASPSIGKASDEIQPAPTVKGSFSKVFLLVMALIFAVGLGVLVHLLLPVFR